MRNRGTNIYQRGTSAMTQACPIKGNIDASQRIIPLLATLVWLLETTTRAGKEGWKIGSSHHHKLAVGSVLVGTAANIAIILRCCPYTSDRRRIWKDSCRSVAVQEGRSLMVAMVSMATDCSSCSYSCATASPIQPLVPEDTLF